jgi:parallel beta-helix repeat protein
MLCLYSRKQLEHSIRLTLVFVLIIPLLLASKQTAQAATSVGGPIITDTTWTLENSPYIVTASVVVSAGVTLTIQPGVTVKFDNGYSLQVNGGLIAQGTALQPIAFTSNQASPAPDDWGGILFTGTAIPTTVDADGNYLSGSILKYCSVKYGGQNVDAAITAHSLLIDHCTVENNEAQGIDNSGIAGEPSWTTNNTIRYNTPLFHPYYGLIVSDGMVIGNTISDNSRQGAYIGSNVLVQNNTVTQNGLDGISVKQASSGIDILSNAISSNGGRGIAITYSGQNITIRENNITRNLGGIYIGGYPVSSSNILISHNDILYNMDIEDGGAGIYISESIYITISENTIDGNSAREGGSAKKGGGILLFKSNNISVLNNVITRNIDQGVCGGICSEGWVNSSVISDNIIVGNIGGGILVSDGDNIIDGNIIASNTLGWGIRATNITYSSISCYIRNNVIINNSAYLNYAHGAGAFIQNCAEFSHNLVLGNVGSATASSGGLEIDGTPEVHYNSFYGNLPFDVTVVSSNNISGTHNYWGTVNSADILAHVVDRHDNTSLGEFLYDPYLLEPSPDTPFPPPLGLVGNFLNDSVSLSWQPLPIFETGWGYKVYYDNDSFIPPFEGMGLTEGDSPINVGDQTTFTLSGLDSKKDYYITVTAYDNEGRESWYSNILVQRGGYRIYLSLVGK